ncbi:MAG: cytochrome-c oxidase, partial [Candidatus Limnocylindria bacterium]
TKPGKYEAPCAELCGFGHSGMRGWIYVHTAEEYAKWAAANLGPGVPATQSAQAEPTPEKTAARGERGTR